MAGLLLSVVVPFHNAEANLGECLDSVRRQTYRNLEVILVDDASTDHSLAIAEAYAARDPRLRLIRACEDHRSSRACEDPRNAGVVEASGDLLAFLDGDDVLPAYSYDLLVAALREGGGDLAAGNVDPHTLGGIRPPRPHREILRATNLRTHVSADHGLLRDRTVEGKVFRMPFWSEHGFAFPVGRAFEDELVAIAGHVLASSVAVVNRSVYYRREGMDRSRSRTRDDQSLLMDRFQTLRAVRQFLTDGGHVELRSTYDEVVLSDELRDYLALLPSAGPDYQRAFLNLTHEWLGRVDPGIVKRLAPRWRRKWTLVQQGRLAELIEEIRDESRPLEGAPDREAPARFALNTGVHMAAWRHDRLEISGHAFVDGAGARRPWTSARLIWLREASTRRVVIVPTRPLRYPAASTLAQDARHRYDWSGFTVSIDPEALRAGGNWREGEWTVAVGATGGTRLRRGGLRAVGAALRLRPHELAPGVRVTPILAEGVLRLRVDRPRAWATAVRLAGDSLELEGLVEGDVNNPSEITLCRVDGLASHSFPAVMSPAPDGRHSFVARVSCACLAAIDETPGHLSGLDADTFGVEIALADAGTMPVAAAAGLGQVRVRSGSDEVCTHVQENGYLSLRVRPLGPVVTRASWQADDTLLLAGDWPGPGMGELLLRVRGRRREVVVPMVGRDGGWQAIVRPSAVDTLAGPLPLVAGVWDLRFRRIVRRQVVVAGLPFADAAFDELPLAHDIGGRGFSLDPAGAELAALRVETDLAAGERSPFAQRALRERHHGPRTRGIWSQPPLRDVVLFDAFGGRRVADSPRAILGELRRQGSDLRALWTVRDRQVNPERAAPLPMYTEQWYAALASSRYVITNDRLPGWFWRRHGQVVVQTGRGWPIKRLDGGAAEDASAWSALVSPSRFATSLLRRAFAYDGEVLEIGRPANDIFHRPDGEMIRSLVRQRLGLAPGARVVLYAPTRRLADMRADGRGDAARLLDVRRLRDGLPPDHVLLLRRHPYLVDDISGAGNGVQDVSDYPDAAELLLATDILVTDYSSLVADFANTGRPILCYVPDLDQFREETGFSVDFEYEAPGPLIRRTDDLVEAVRDIAAVASSYQVRYQAFVERFCDLDDGKAGARLVDWLFAQDL